MSEVLLLWNVYDIRSEAASLIGVSLRGRVRKYGAENGINVLVENASDVDNCVRFALLGDTGYTEIGEFVLRIVPDASITLALTDVINPVLSKLSIITNEVKYKTK